MPSWTAGGYTMNPVGPQIDPRYPVFRPDNPVAIGTDDIYRDTFAGGVLRGFQNRPKAAPGYAAMPGTAEYAAAQGQLPQSMGGLLPDLYSQSQQVNAGLLGNAAGNVISGGEGVNPFYGSQVVPTNPSGIYTATPTDPNAPVDTAPSEPEMTGFDAWRAMNINSMLQGQNAGGYGSQAEGFLTGMGTQWADMDDEQKRRAAAAIAQTVRNPSDLDSFMSALSGPATAENLKTLGVTASGNMGQLGDMEMKLAKDRHRASPSQKR